MQNNPNNSYNNEEPYNGYPGSSSYYNDVNRFVDCEREQKAKNNTVLIVLVAVLATVSIVVSAFALILLNSDDSEKTASGTSAANNGNTPSVADNSQQNSAQVPNVPVVPEKPVITEPVKTVYVDCNTTLVLREGPGKEYGKKTSIPTGAALGFYEFAGNGFARVRYNGTDGYVSAEYISDYRPDVWEYNEADVRAFVEQVLYDYVNAINYDNPEYVGRHCIGEARDKSYANHGSVKQRYASEQVISVNTHTVKRVGKKQVTVIRESVIRTWGYDGTVRDVKEKYLTTVDYTSSGMKVSKFKAM